jgi:hypothetical protein
MLKYINKLLRVFNLKICSISKNRKIQDEHGRLLNGCCRLCPSIKGNKNPCFYIDNYEINP